MLPALRRTLVFMAIILGFCVLSLPWTIPFAFDAPETTWSDVVPALIMVYGVYVLLPWFVIAFVFNLWRARRGS